MDFQVGFPVFLLQNNGSASVVIDPMGNQRTISHMGFLQLVARLDAHELRHEAVEQIGVIRCAVGLGIGQKPQLNQFRVGNVIEGEEVGSCLFDSAAVRFQCIGRHAGQELAAAVAETLVQVGVQVVADGIVAGNHLSRFLVGNKLLAHPVFRSVFVVSIGDVGNRDALRAMHGTNPVGIGQVDADGCRGIFVATEHRRTHRTGRHTRHFFLLKSLIHGRMIFEPLRVLADDLGTTRGHKVFVLYQCLPRGFQPEWIAINFYETIDEIYLAFGLFQPFDGIFIENP